MPSIGELFVELGIKADVEQLVKFEKALKQGKGAAEKTTDAFSKLQKGIKAFKASLPFLAVTQIIHQLNQLSDALTSANQAWVNFSRQTNLSLNSLQGYAGVASLLDKSLGMEGAASSLSGLEQRLFAMRLTGEGAQGFQLAGINPMGTNAFGVIEQMRERFKGLDNNAATYLMQQMGLDPKLLPMIRMTKEEFQDLQRTVERYQLSAKQREEIQKLNTQLQLAGMKLQYLKDRAVLAILPAWTEFMKSVSRVSELLGRFVNWVIKGETLSAKLTQGLIKLAAAIGVVKAAFWALSSHPIIATITAILGALYLLFDDIAVFLNGGDSMIGVFVQGWNDAIGKLVSPETSGIDKLKTSLEMLTKIPVPPALQGIITAANAAKWLNSFIDNFSNKSAFVNYSDPAQVGIPLSRTAYTSTTYNTDNRQINQNNTINTTQTGQTIRDELAYAQYTFV